MSEHLKHQNFKLNQRQVPAWLFSFGFHLAVILTIVLLMYRVSGGVGDVETRVGGIVLVKADSETTEFLSEGEVTEVSDEQMAMNSSSSAPMIANESLPPDLPGIEFSNAELTGVADSIGNAFSDVPNTTGSNSNGIGSGQLGGRITTEVFGVKGTGNRFVYVFDRSASMEDMGGKPLRAAKSQLLRSLGSLGENNQFQIIFYNDKTKIFSSSAGRSGLINASEVEKLRAQNFVGAIRGERGTDHLAALQKALSFGPDVIFLLTDAEGGFSARELAMISHWNRSSAVINTIEFGMGNRQSSDGSLRRVAEESLGQYIYKDVRSFRN